MRLPVVLLLIFVSSVAIAQIKGKVVSIIDGDTFKMLTENNELLKIRLHGIDCPEQSQDFGTVAKTFLSDLIFNKTVTAIEKDMDRYGRTVAIVMIGEKNVNEELLSAGLAWHYKRYDQNADWAELESKAKDLKKGLWQKDGAVPPWEFRKTRSAR